MRCAGGGREMTSARWRTCERSAVNRRTGLGGRFSPLVWRPALRRHRGVPGQALGRDRDSGTGASRGGMASGPGRARNAGSGVPAPTSWRGSCPPTAFERLAVAAHAKWCRCRRKHVCQRPGCGGTSSPLPKLSALLPPSFGRRRPVPGFPQRRRNSRTLDVAMQVTVPGGGAARHNADRKSVV